jgi:hypothetical protein
VAASTSASLLIKLLTVLSTGLLMLQYINIEYDNATLLARDKFDSGGWPSYTSNTANLDAVQIVATKNPTRYIPFPVGTTAEFAFPSLTLEDPSLCELIVTFIPLLVLALTKMQFPAM